MTRVVRIHWPTRYKRLLELIIYKTFTLYLLTIHLMILDLATPSNFIFFPLYMAIL